MTILEMLTAQKDELKTRAKSVEDINELRSIHEQIEKLDTMIAQAESEERQAPPVEAETINGSIVGAFAATAQEETRESENPYATMEYRQAFKDYIQRGKWFSAEMLGKISDFRNSLPAEQRAGVPVTTVDTGAAIPTTVMREIINTVRKRYGNLYSKVRKTALPGGVRYPVGALQGTFKWIGEGSVSPNQNVGKLGSVSFEYHTAEMRVAQTLLSQLLTVPEFEAQIAEVIAVAYLQAMDYAIVRGTGKGMPLGILNDGRIPASHKIALTAADISNWQAWRKKFFAKVPKGYRNGEFAFGQSTVDAYLETMSDAQNNPIFRQATGLEMADGDTMDDGRFYGRALATTEADILGDFDDAEKDEAIGFFWQPDMYAINEPMGFNLLRYIDHNTNEVVDKAIAVADGKILNPEGFYIFVKG